MQVAPISLSGTPPAERTLERRFRVDDRIGLAVDVDAHVEAGVVAQFINIRHNDNRQSYATVSGNLRWAYAPQERCLKEKEEPPA